MTVFLVSTIEKIKRIMRRIWMLILECTGFWILASKL